MTSDARELLRKLALNFTDRFIDGGEYSNDDIYALRNAALDVVAEPPAAAHGDHDALLELRGRMECGAAWKGEDEWWEWVQKQIDELRARPRAVPDVYPDDLGTPRDARALSERCHELARRLVKHSSVAPDAGAHVEEALAARMDKAWGPVTRDIHKQPQPAPEEPDLHQSGGSTPPGSTPVSDCMTSMWSSRVCQHGTNGCILDHGASSAHRREQAQASEAAKEWAQAFNDSIIHAGDWSQTQLSAGCKMRETALMVWRDRDRIRHDHDALRKENERLQERLDETMSNSEVDEENLRLRKENEALRSDKGILEARVTERDQHIENQRARLKQLEYSCTSLRANNDKVRGEVGTISKQRDAAREEVQALLAEIAALKDRLEIIKKAVDN